MKKLIAITVAWAICTPAAAISFAALAILSPVVIAYYIDKRVMEGSPIITIKKWDKK